METWLVLLLVSSLVFLVVIPIAQRRRDRHRYLVRDQYHQPPTAGLGTDEQRRDAMRDNPFVTSELNRARRGR